jgi:hypothetical protein
MIDSVTIWLDGRLFTRLVIWPHLYPSYYLAVLCRFVLFFV